MNNLINLYPNTNFSEVNLDYIITLVRQNAGLHLELSGNQLLLKTLDGSTVSAVTVAYATEAGNAQYATNATNAVYATNANNADTATNATNASHALTADSATTAGSAITATSATTAGTATEAVHATTADTATNATNATHASTADYATTTGSVEHADNAFEAVSANGIMTRFTRGNGTTVDFSVPCSIMADRDTQNNVISRTYITNVVDNNGTLEFKNALGTTIVSITPSSQTATEDSYGNTIADFIKAITAPSDSNYVTVTHGTGTAETLTVNYSNKAWKDTNGNVIKNFYIGSLEIVQDDDTGHYCLVCYNGDTPKAELFRTEINAYSAQIAEEAEHATNADYATNAGTATEASHATTADSATTSTGSISSITTPSDEYNSFTINNGDGSTKKIDIHNKSIIECNLYGDGIKTDPIDLAVNASEDYEVDPNDLTKYRYFSDVSDFITPNIYFIYVTQSGGVELFTSVSQKTTINGVTAIVWHVFNGTTIEVLQITASNTEGYVTITRLL